MTDLGLMNVRNLPNCFFKDLTRPLLLQKRGRGWFVKTSRYTVRLAIGGGIIPQTTPHLLCKRRGQVYVELAKCGHSFSFSAFRLFYTSNLLIINEMKSCAILRCKTTHIRWRNRSFYSAKRPISQSKMTGIERVAHFANVSSTIRSHHTVTIYHVQNTLCDSRLTLTTKEVYNYMPPPSATRHNSNPRH